jgi:hypothetical protein
MIAYREENPYPTNILKIGPAIVDVIAISPHPILVISKKVIKSPRQFPQEIKKEIKA